jgi:amino acid transporter
MAVIFFVSGADPIVTLVPAMLGFGTLAVLILQGLAALSIVVYFRRRGDRRLWSTLIAPGIGFLGIAAISILAIWNFDIVAGSSELWIRLLPLLLVAALIGGVAYAGYLKRRRPEVYGGLEADLERFNVHTRATEVVE